MQWDGEAFETAAYAAGGVVAMMRSHDEWSAAAARKGARRIAADLDRKDRRGRAKAMARGDRPLAGMRVLDLSRVIAGPVAGRTLAAHGADVLLISGPELPAIPWLTIDTGRGKLTSFVELKSEQGRDDAARPAGAGGYLLARLSAACAGSARLLAGGCRAHQSRHRLCVAVGLWPCRAMGGAARLRLAGADHDRLQPRRRARPPASTGPKELPAQMLDHATGYLMAFGAMMAKARQSREGGSWHVRVSLAQTGRWLWNLGRVADGFKTEDLKGEAVSPFMEEMPSGLRSAASGQPFGGAVENAGVLGAPGDAARQSPAAMAGARLNGMSIQPIENSRPSVEILTSKAVPIAFFGCLKQQFGTISAAMRQIAAGIIAEVTEAPCFQILTKRLQDA